MAADNAPGTTTPLGGAPDTTLGLVSGNLAADQAELQSQEAILDQDQSSLSQYRAQLDADAADFDPTGAAGPQPQFNEPTPQDHFQDVMKVTPLLMALGAVGGAFTKQHGITMLASTNAMMKGVVQGDADAYKQAREDYEQRYQDFRDKSKTWLDVYKAYASAYKGRIDADKLAVIGANNAVGADRKDVNMTKGDIAKMIQLRAQLDKAHQQATHMSNEDATALIRAQNDAEKAAAATKNADTNATRVATANSKTAAKQKDKDAKSQADKDEIVNMIDSSLQDLKGKTMMTGTGGAIRRAGETIANVTGISDDNTASRFADKQALLRTKLTAYLKETGGRLGADERRILQSGIDVIDQKMTSTQQGQTKLAEVKKVLSGGYKSQQPVTKVIGGVTYTQRDGKWYAN